MRHSETGVSHYLCVQHFLYITEESSMKSKNSGFLKMSCFQFFSHVHTPTTMGRLLYSSLPDPIVHRYVLVQDARDIGPNPVLIQADLLLISLLSGLSIYRTLLVGNRVGFQPKYYNELFLTLFQIWQQLSSLSSPAACHCHSSNTDWTCHLF